MRFHHEICVKCTYNEISSRDMRKMYVQLNYLVVIQVYIYLHTLFTASVAALSYLKLR